MAFSDPSCVSFFQRAKPFLSRPTSGAPFYIYSYYVLTNFLQDLQDQRVPALKSLDENNEKALEMLWPTMMQHWKLWPIVHSFNFYFVPIHHRVLVQV